MTTLTRTHGPLLHPGITVLIRPNGAVQLGWDPERAVLVQPPGPVEAVPALLRLLDGVRTRQQIVCQARELGFAADTTESLLRQMAAAGLLLAEQPRSRLRTVRVHGRGPLSDALLAGVRRIGLRPSHSREGDRTGIDRIGAPSEETERPDLLILADTLVPDPGLVADLMRRRIPHLQVRMRDGRGIVGPLVLPGESSCLHCADLHRLDRDPEWTHLAAQLLGRVGYASPAGIAGAAALALKEIEIISRGEAGNPPATLNATLEVDFESPHIDRRRWLPHPDCGCRAGGGADGAEKE